MELVKCSDCENLQEKYPKDEEVLYKGANYFNCYVGSNRFINDYTVLDVDLGIKRGIVCKKFKAKKK